MLFLHQTNVKYCEYLAKKSYPYFPGPLSRRMWFAPLYDQTESKVIARTAPENVSAPLFKTSLSLGCLSICNYPSPTSFTAIYPAAEGNEMGSYCHCVCPWKYSIGN